MIPLNGDYLRASIKDISPEQKRGKLGHRFLFAFMATCGLALAVSVGRYFAS